MHMMSKTDLSSGELDTLRRSRNPTTNESLFSLFSFLFSLFSFLFSLFSFLFSLFSFLWGWQGRAESETGLSSPVPDQQRSSSCFLV